MRLIVIGCEYSGTSTLGYHIGKWGKEALGDDLGFHDHWQIPHVSHPNIPEGKTHKEMVDDFLAGKGIDPSLLGHSDEENRAFLALTPKQQEAFQRYHMEYHVADTFYEDPHHNQIGFHINEAVYAPRYYGYGGAREYADRSWYARRVESDIMHKAPDSVLILVKASADAIKARLKANPHPFGLVQEGDVEEVLADFQHQYDQSWLRHKFEIDTTNATQEESLAEFAEKIEGHLTDTDRAKIMYYRQKKAMARMGARD